MSSFDLSIVSGTFNRLHWLQKMVNSVRQSLNGWYNVTHEIILVDGGSSDGTQAWCKAQPDVRLIEHGQLLGAIRAFNDGAYAARGQYVILANDDVEFIGDSVPRAWVYMQANPEVGMGCFFQDRSTGDRPPDPWHVECQMCVIQDDNVYKPVHFPYGQVAISPKALGDRLGWWGDFGSKTYGGDNEFSSNVYESGYAVRPLYYGPKTGLVTRVTQAETDQISCIHDNKPSDALRLINNEGVMGDPSSRSKRYGYHPDSWAYGRRWTQQKWQAENQRRGAKNKLSGPLVRTEPQFPIPINHKERFVYLPIYERGWEIQKQQKRGLREALARAGAVLEVDYVSAEKPLAEAIKAIDRMKPTIILCQFHGADPINADGVAALRSRAPGAWLVNWNGDYWPQNLLSEQGIALARAFDTQLTVNRSVLEDYWKKGINAAYWQIGWEPDGRGHNPNPEDRCDVVFLANGYSKERQQFVSRLKALPFSFRLWGNGWPNGWAVGQCTYDFITACRAYRGARFSIGDSQWPDSGFVSNRVMQALAAGSSALCHQWFRGMEELGLEDGQTCIVWRDFDDLTNKLNYYAKREEHRASIAAAGERLAVERHSFDVRVRELLAMKPGAVEDWR